MADDYDPDDPHAGTQRVDTTAGFRGIVLRTFKLIATGGPVSGREFVLDGARIRIGSHADNELVIGDPSVSKQHLVIERRPEGYHIRDLGSTNGTIVNGIRITDAFLADGAVIALGQTTLKFIPQEERVQIRPSRRDSFGSLVGSSPRMRQVFGVLELFAPSDLPILITGETGTGKELTAQGIHEMSARHAGPLEVFDCASVAANLMESELFGHTRGSFTGADSDRAGMFELAHRGTLFIDEIGELPLDMQPKLLRALEAKEVKRLGAGSTVKVDVRIVAATHRDLAAMVERGTFREDLYYRLSVIRVELPPLRERLEDLPVLVARLAQDRARFTPEALGVLRSQPWKGNVRELRNAVQAALAIAGEGPVTPEHLYFAPARSAAPASAPATLAGKTLEDIEKEAIRAALVECGGNKSQVARKLDIAYSTLQLKIKKYGLAGT